MKRSLQFIKENIPRSFVNVMPPLNIQILLDTHKNPFCLDFHQWVYLLVQLTPLQSLLFLSPVEEHRGVRRREEQVRRDAVQGGRRRRRDGHLRGGCCSDHRLHSTYPDHWSNPHSTTYTYATIESSEHRLPGIGLFPLLGYGLGYGCQAHLEIAL